MAVRPDPSPDQSIPTHQQRIGRRLREMRLQRRYSLAQLAKATGLSQSFLSLLENGRTDITIGRLMRLVTFFDTSLLDLVPDEASIERVVMRHDDNLELRSSSEGLRLFLLARNASMPMTPVLATFERAGSTDEYTHHAGYEFLYVLEGKLSLSFLEAEPLILSPGDSAYFRADRPHKYGNAGRSELKFLTVTTPPLVEAPQLHH
jgi:transcriptional regulator with XRE-family HTH domain